MNAVIEVKGSAPTVTVSWEKKNEEEGEGDDSEKRSNGSDQMTTKEPKGSGEDFSTELLFFIEEH